MSTRILKVTMTVDIPKVPNYFRLSDSQVVPIYAVTEAGLREIGAAWTEALIARAAEMKANDEHPTEQPR